ncbi:MAG TPA: hypothetical protein PLZ15_09915 [Melioribacteraceae bacterium]|nr:hypothetical protein [Melioribacteraceae bacterium]
MNQLIHILKYKAIAFIRLNDRLDLAGLIKNFGSSLIYIGFAVGAFFFSRRLIQFLMTDIKIGLFLLHEFISIILFIFFLAVNIGNIIVSYSTLYKSNEIGFLFTKPVTPVKIFILKFLDNFFYSSSTLLLILLSVLLGYASYFQMRTDHLLLLIIGNFIPFIFSAGSLGVIILMILMKLGSRFNPRRVVTGLALLYIIIVSLFFTINSPLELTNSVLKYYPFIERNIYLNDLLPPVIKYLPNSWLAESSYWLITNQLSNAIPLFISQILLSTVLFIIALFLGNRLYFKTWLLNLKISGDFKGDRHYSNLFLDFSRKSRMDSRTESILKKDFWVFVREPAQWIHLLVLCFLIIVFISSVSGIRYVGLGNFYLQTGIYLSVFLFNMLLISTLSLRFIFPMISLEGYSFWKIKSAPVNNSFFLRKKLVPMGTLILLISTGLSYFINFRFFFVFEISALLINLIAAVTIILINLGMGGLFANYREKNAIRVSSSQGASITFLLVIIYILLIVILLFQPVSQYFLSIMIQQSYDPLKVFYPVIPVALLSAFIIILSIRGALYSLKKDF